ncbi:NADH dehydrogenase [ubiquinone] 1 alpha subcomplex subunit 13-like [Dreissena polymorpha]|uniref:NADH dehydrogenase [ubiquinone] 1 alpha subcomplex subunit 13 n=1 Tax=Dreissena polymorpha TaxID=45954 RepID=A0A9D4KDA2_DREPO|nr:NADH dehydrogenase [ubiquinone] 1 alpha subcomplex subunit 13-like [Dreissena polymorpha]KAH3837423.1 hypothetical protein DPMN_110812 [Dreissena polymorpha]
MVGYRQDAAPKGGYANIQWAKAYVAKPLNGAKILIPFVALKAVAMVTFIKYYQPKMLREKIQENDARLILSVLFQAENDRRLLKNFRRMRDEEARLFANDPNWEVGKYNGEKAYLRDDHMFTALQSYDLDIYKPFSFIETFCNFFKND